MIIWSRLKRVPHSLGFETKGGVFEPMVKKGWPLGVSASVIFTTADPDQSSIEIRPFQGEEKLTARNTALGLFEITEIPPAPAREPKIEVTFQVLDASGAFTITARDTRTGRDLPVLQR